MYRQEVVPVSNIGEGDQSRVRNSTEADEANRRVNKFGLHFGSIKCHQLAHKSMPPKRAWSSTILDGPMRNMP